MEAQDLHHPSIHMRYQTALDILESFIENDVVRGVQKIEATFMKNQLDRWFETRFGRLSQDPSIRKWDITYNFNDIVKFVNSIPVERCQIRQPR